MVVFRVLKKIGKILTRHQKIRILELGILMIFSGFLEMLSVTMIIPFIQLVLEPEMMLENEYVRNVSSFLAVNDPVILMAIMAFTMALIYIIKNVFLLFQQTMQNRYVYRQLFILQKKMLHRFLLFPYEFYLNITSGEVLRIIRDDTTDAFKSLTALLSFFSEMIVTIVLVLSVFLISPQLTLSVGLILIAMVFMIQKVTQPMIKNCGKKNWDTSVKMNQWLMQAVQGIKEIKIMRKGNYFEQNYQKEGDVHARAIYRYMTIVVAPRFLLEAATMGTIFSVVGVMILRGSDMKQLVPALSAIAMASIRLLPAASRISSCLSDLTFSEPMVDKLLENAHWADSDNKYSGDETLTSDRSEMISRLSDRIVMKNIHYIYPTGTADVLKDAEMEIRKGMSVGVVGASGAGKTTVVDIMLGLLKPKSGKVLVDGTDIEFDMEGWLSQIGYIPQSIFMLDGTIRENVAFGIQNEDISDERVWEALKGASLYEYVRNLPEMLDSQIGERGVRLSGGQRQRIGIARALYADPAVLFFDEATSALDNETESAIMESIDHLRGEKTMVIIAHRLTTIEKCDVVYRVENGKMIRER